MWMLTKEKDLKVNLVTGKKWSGFVRDSCLGKGYFGRMGKWFLRGWEIGCCFLCFLSFSFITSWNSCLGKGYFGRMGRGDGRMGWEVECCFLSFLFFYSFLHHNIRVWIKDILGGWEEGLGGWGFKCFPFSSFLFLLYVSCLSKGHFGKMGKWILGEWEVQLCFLSFLFFPFGCIIRSVLN